jgi:hypothetical protein
MKFAYADPPYFGLAEKFYGKLHPEAAEYDKIEPHAALVDRLCSEFDGWAMSLQSTALKHILPLCPPDTRVMAWVKPLVSFKPGVNPGYCWEPVLVRGCRKRPRYAMTIRDYLSENMAIQKGLRGAKPDGFCFWIFAVLGIRAEDEFTDLFPGSGSVARAFEKWRAMIPFEDAERLIEAQILTTDRTVEEQREDDAA